MAESVLANMAYPLSRLAPLNLRGANTDRSWFELLVPSGPPLPLLRTVALGRGSQALKSPEQLNVAEGRKTCDARRDQVTGIAARRWSRVGVELQHRAAEQAGR
ncbi:hypothetical protein [Nocardia sp. NRRL S-836]|uniref:hypothetical protein n=1 Tax=Nocardia sp. NRRL S-836 TaxID=1519492 RepID=UPI0012FC6EDF|nr:hypothetical protein [Nocardia sp. NRRL S-836]